MFFDEDQIPALPADHADCRDFITKLYRQLFLSNQRLADVVGQRELDTRSLKGQLKSLREKCARLEVENGKLHAKLMRGAEDGCD